MPAVLIRVEEVNWPERSEKKSFKRRVQKERRKGTRPLFEKGRRPGEVAHGPKRIQPHECTLLELCKIKTEKGARKKGGLKGKRV